MPRGTALQIGIDAGPLLGQGGVSRYLAPLIRSLLTIDSPAQYRLLLRRSWISRQAVRTLEQMAPVWPMRVPDRLLTWWWEHLGTTFPVGRTRWNSLDLFLATWMVAPVLRNGKVVSIVYDLTPIRLPELFAQHAQFRSKMESFLQRSQAIVAISQRTKQDLVDLLGIDEKLIWVVYPGLGQEFRPLSQSHVAAVATRYGIHGRYILYVGAVGPHKNVPALLQAYRQARLDRGFAAKLVLVIRSGWGRQLHQLVGTLCLSDHVLRLGSVPAQDLPALYAGAELFVYPSRYEGFGLPVLEAMACGTPVIVADRGALPEVAGEAGYYVDPESPCALAEAMCHVLEDQELRANLQTAGLKQAARFCWTISARVLLGLFEEVANRRAVNA
ncbi:MAG: glycosyltransferase family 1 protein [Acidobacteriota bacterium]